MILGNFSEREKSEDADGSTQDPSRPLQTDYIERWQLAGVREKNFPKVARFANTSILYV